MNKAQELNLSVICFIWTDIKAFGFTVLSESLNNIVSIDILCNDLALKATFSVRNIGMQRFS